MAYDINRALANAAKGSSNSVQKTNSEDFSQQGNYNAQEVLNQQDLANGEVADRMPAPVSDSANNINPKLSRNNTPYQDITRIAGLIERASLPSVWERSIPCPCINPVTNQPRSDCPICKGRGLIFRDPIELQIMYQSNYKNPANGEEGPYDLGVTIATPQITDSGIENGISFRDRLTIKNMSIAQSFIFNATERKIANGVFIPYLVLKFDKVLTIKQNKVSELKEGVDFTYNKSTNQFFVNDQYRDLNISMNISVQPRFYVTDIDKEIRYFQVKKLEDKTVAEGNSNDLLTNYKKNNFITSKLGIDYYRAPKKLILKREDLFIDVADFTGENDKPTKEAKFVDPKKYDTSITDLLGGH